MKYFKLVTQNPWKNRILNNPWSYVIFAAFVYFVRAFEYILKPQLYAEDGTEWLAGGFNHSILYIFKPLNGFFHVPERMFGILLAKIIPLNYAPFISNFTAFVIFCVLVYYLFSSRSKIFSNNFQKIFALLSICLMANVDEFFFNFSNSIFLLGIISTLIFLAIPSKNKLVRLLEKSTYLLTCFTLPFVWLLLPLNIIEKVKYKSRERFFLYAAVAGSITQFIAYTTSHAARSSVTIRALISRYTILEIHNQIIVPALRFTRIDTDYKTFGVYATYTVTFLFAITVTGCIYVMVKSNKQVNYLLAFLGLMTLASLKSPIVSSASAQEAVKSMTAAAAGDRYFIFGIIGLAIVFAKLLDSLMKYPIKLVVLAIFILFGTATSLHYRSFFIEKSFVDYRNQYADGLTELKKKETGSVNIPSNPQGWTITLQK